MAGFNRIIALMILCICTMAFTAAQGQYYNSALGLRLANGAGISGKLGLSDRASLEGIISTRWEGVNFTVLAEAVVPLADTPGLSWYLGAGAHIGFWDYPKDAENNTELFIGVDGVLGMEYTFEEVPINLSLDWKPAFHLLSHTGFNWDDFALSVRYVINRR